MRGRARTTRGDDAGPLLNLPLYYPEVNGTALLRERIAALYPQAAAQNVLVTVGASQANALVCSTLLEPGDEVVVISPGYRQVWGLARNIGCRVRELPLRPEDDWRVDLDRLAKLAGSKTKLMAVVNPNNPTGTILSAEEMRRAVDICARTGAWLHADEVYCGTELEGPETPTFWGQYDRLICTNSLSKAYGLAGLRIGWAIAGPETIRSFVAATRIRGDRGRCAEHDAGGDRPPARETQDAAATATEALARRAPDSGELVREQNGRFFWKTPPATSIAFVRSHLNLSSVELANHIREKSSVLVAPGAYLGTEHHLRIAVGYPPEKVQTALHRLGGAVSELAFAERPSTRHAM
jgi:aspartate/methionine/tyrosine aminotransferase